MRKKDFWKSTKVCPGCKQDLEFVYYHKNKSKPYGIESRCKSCELDRKKNSYRRGKNMLDQLDLLYQKILLEGELD